MHGDLEGKAYCEVCDRPLEWDKLIDIDGDGTMACQSCAEDAGWEPSEAAQGLIPIPDDYAEN